MVKDTRMYIKVRFVESEKEALWPLRVSKYT